MNEQEFCHYCKEPLGDVSVRMLQKPPNQFHPECAPKYLNEKNRAEFKKFEEKSV